MTTKARRNEDRVLEALKLMADGVELQEMTSTLKTQWPESEPGEFQAVIEEAQSLKEKLANGKNGESADKTIVKNGLQYRVLKECKEVPQITVDWIKNDRRRARLTDFTDDRLRDLFQNIDTDIGGFSFTFRDECTVNCNYRQPIWQQSSFLFVVRQI